MVTKYNNYQKIRCNFYLLGIPGITKIFKWVSKIKTTQIIFYVKISIIIIILFRINIYNHLDIDQIAMNKIKTIYFYHIKKRNIQ